MAASMSFPRLFCRKMVVGRFFHSSPTSLTNPQTASLARLRKMTGYSMSNCKKALQLHPEDLTKAEEWLHEEAKKQGWLKIANLEHRPAVQGLVGVHIQGSNAALVEVNCETDFVARNTEFQSLVTKVLSACLNNMVDTSSEEECIKLNIDSPQLCKFETESGTLGDLNASAVGKFGEKTIIRRAVCFKARDNVFLSSFSHPTVHSSDLPGATLGKYGGIVALKPSKTCEQFDKSTVEELGRQLCQHVVGMNPESIGTMPDKETEKHDENYGVKLQENDMKEDIIIADHQSENDGESSDSDDKAIDSNETSLLRQQFLLDPDVTVGELLLKNSLEVLDFHRFECGEQEMKPE